MDFHYLICTDSGTCPLNADNLGTRTINVLISVDRHIIIVNAKQGVWSEGTAGRKSYFSGSIGVGR